MTGYVRVDTGNNIADGNVINATDLDNEFDGVQAAFNSSTGHVHDGTSGNGAPITKLGPVQDVVVSISSMSPKTTNTVDLGTSSLKYKDLFLAGNASVAGTTTLSSALTYGGVTLSNAVTGTGNMVLSASPTFTGTAGFANVTASGTLGVTSTATFTGAIVNDSTADSTSTTTGAIQTDGGLGVAKALWVGGLANITGVATFTAQPILSSLTASRAVFSDASKGLVSNAITGTGNVVMSNSPTLVTPALGTPSALIGTNITGTASGLTAGKVTTNANLTGAVTSVGNATSLGSFTSAQLSTALTDETGSGAAVFATSPTFVTPALGTPSSGVLTNATGLPIATGVSGLGTGIATALAVNVGSAGSAVVNGGALGTPASGVLTNATGLPISSGVSGLGTGVATALAVNVGTAGAAVINGGVLGTPSSGTVTNLTGTASININGTVGATTASTGAFTTLSASSTVSGTGFSTYLASPPAIGGTAAAAGTFTTLSATGNVTLGDAAADTVTVNGTTNFVVAPTVGGVGQNGFKNRIINGAMVIDQRNAGASVTVSSYGYVLDRFGYSISGGGAFTAQRSTTVPSGFINSQALTVSTPDSSIAAGDVYQAFHKIEGFNFADMGFGTANAQTFTLSFWVRSSITGTYAVGFNNNAFNRSYVATYTINSANTWEQKTITVVGDTSGTWLTDNNIGINISFDLGSGSNFNATAGSWGAGSLSRTSGSVNWIATSGATFYITGVQLEKGSTATSFDYRPFGTELSLCQRYCFVGLAGTGGYAPSSTITAAYGRTAVTMRASPTATTSSISFGNASGLVIDQLTPDRYRNYFTITSSGGGDCTYTLKLESEL